MQRSCANIAAITLFVSGSVATSPTIIQVVADDLGYNDLGFSNGGRTHTPHIDAAVAAGISMPYYHTYKVCSPSRASIMTGRYPWGVGYYDMKGPEMVPLDTDMLPAVLKKHAKYEAYAIGKWNLGNLVKDYTPTFRGFDGFLGYYAAAQGDYWYHGNPTSCGPGASQYTTDLSNSSGAGDPNGIKHAPDSLNGTYNEDFFTGEAIRLIGQHAARQSTVAAGDQTGLYIYLAYQNVHTTAQNARSLSGTHPLHAPCNVVDTLYARTTPDTYKVMGGMLTMLDYGIGNITNALHAAGIPYLITFCADNGGPLPHSTNAPLRGGKHTLWDGGVRVRAWISGTAIPTTRRGKVWEGLAHSSDWYLTLIEGVAGVSLTPDNINATGPRFPDSHNLWPALLSGGDSPRTEIIHQVVNSYTDEQKLTDPPVIRSGKWKLILGDPGDSRIVSWPAPVSSDVPFGQTNGSRDGYDEERRAKKGNCRAVTLKAPPGPKMCASGCLFDLSKDESESHNLINDTTLADVVAQLTQRLKDAAATGPPWAFPLSKGPLWQQVNQEICDEEEKTGYIEPVRTSLPASPPPTPAPAPGPPTPKPADCTKTLKSACPLSHFKATADCLTCTRKHANAPICTPKERNQYCKGVNEHTW